MTRVYTEGARAALRILGVEKTASILRKVSMQLEFNSAAERAQHEKMRGVAGGVTGFVGGLAGNVAGGVAGTAAGGPVGSMAGSMAGEHIGEKLFSAPVTTAIDASHDIKQRGAKRYNQTMGALNAAAGLPPRRYM